MRIAHVAWLVMAVSSAAAAPYAGPIVHWNQDPAKTCEVVWLERDGGVAVEGAWATGAAGFGYGDDDDATSFPGMRNQFGSLAIRRTVHVPKGVPGDAVLVMKVRFDDAFIAWLGGDEIARANVTEGAEPAAASLQEAEGWVPFRLGTVDRLLGGGDKVLALQGFNFGLGSSDFTLHPVLVAKKGKEEWTLVGEGEVWEYLAKAKPEEGWRTKTAGLSGTGGSKAAAYLFQWRAGDSGVWQERPVVVSQLGVSRHRVCRAELAGLPPDKTIGFRIERGGAGESYSFRMRPSSGKDVRFVAGGDVFHSRDLMDRMNRTVGKKDPLFALVGGDLAYTNDIAPDRWFEYFDSWAANVRSPDGRLIPTVLAIGNHEIKGAGFHPRDAPGPEAATLFYSLFRFPGGEGATHAVDLGDWLSLLMLDSGHTRSISPQKPWIEKALKDRSSVPNLFVCYHRPAWGVGTKPDSEDIQKEWCPLFEKHRVTAVFENDHHVFSRTHPIKGGKVDPENGVPYLGAGAWSVDPRKVTPKDISQRPWIAAAAGKNHVYVVELLEHGYRAAAVDIEGKVFDESERVWRR